jgi:hypothetical protein
MEAAIADRPRIKNDAPASSFTGSTKAVRSFFETPDDVVPLAILPKAAYRYRRAQPPTRAEELPALIDAVYHALSSVSTASHAARIFDAIQTLYLTNRPRDRAIAERIATVHRLALEEGEEILPASLIQFTDFFLHHTDLLLPKITLTPNGTLRARWIHGPEDFVAIEFTGNPLVKLVAEIPRKEGSSTATHFASEPVESVVCISRAIGASF